MEYISKDAAKRIFSKNIGKTVTQLINAIDDFPAADVVERKTGKWLEENVSEDKVIEMWQSAKCSVCGKYHTTPYLYNFDRYNFCPMCGAQMTEGR